ncbi:hypothetical protein V6N00_13040 [Tersicoccus sp. MR15.9]|uniref:hypothetical protein n=1 Tax=Tersicoccus mangrovi TaxID=3121635 RepID=UPI002FE619C6
MITNYTATHIADDLAMLDLEGQHGPVEAVITAIVESCIIQLDGLAVTFTGIAAEQWRFNRSHDGDVVGLTDGRPAVHLEVKSRTAQTNMTKGACRRTGCPGAQTQFHHMAEDGCPVLLLTTPYGHCRGWLEASTDSSVLPTMKTWSDFAAALRVYGNQPVDLLPHLLRLDQSRLTAA